MVSVVRFVILHYHLRPGGIRRIIELATPYILRAFGSQVTHVELLTGEPPESNWLAHFSQTCAPIQVSVTLNPVFRYFSEQTVEPAALAAQMRQGLAEALGDSSVPVLVWAHNLGIGRNLILNSELNRLALNHELSVVSHHHDWWFDNRWRRWSEMVRSEFTLASVSQAVFPAGLSVAHATINREDARLLAQALPQSSFWLPNLNPRSPPPSSAANTAAHRWLARLVGGNQIPVWLLPCRFLRRKNVAEAILLTRWLRPGGFLVTTGDASSAEERPWLAALEAAAEQGNWPVRLAVLRGGEGGTPAVRELIHACEAVLLTSVQEGFGLPYLEAADAGRPLIAREIPNIVPDLRMFGFQLHHLYREVWIDPALFDWPAERVRQQRGYARWLNQLPKSVLQWAVPNSLWEHTEPVPVAFSRLTRVAQLEVLAHPAEVSWRACAVLNPQLVAWREQTLSGALVPEPWPAAADEHLSGEAYAARFLAGFTQIRDERSAGLLTRNLCDGTKCGTDDPRSAWDELQSAFIRHKLEARNLFPILWDEP